MIHAMIMAGGGGTRFWPRSRKALPKQFLNVSSGPTLLQAAYERLEGMAGAGKVWIVTGHAYRAPTLEQIKGMNPDRIVGEPTGRDTAPCVALGAALVALEDPDGVMVVTPADHVIEPVREFTRAVQAAAKLAAGEGDALVTFGIRPTYPSTGYGYIHRGAPIEAPLGVKAYEVKAFCEKPKAEVAERFFTSGDYFWNSGIFVWKASTILNSLKANKPAIYEGVVKIAAAWNTPQREAVLNEIFPVLEKISIDYAVLERHPRVLVVEAPFSWDDVGSWLALERLNPQDASGNTVLAKHQGIETRNCVIVGDKERMITTIGVSDLLIIQDGDATLIAHRKDEGTVKNMVDQLKATGNEKYL